MIVKVCFGTEGHIRIVECHDIHLERMDGYTELICHGVQEEPRLIHLGKGTKDHLYVMDKGETVDHLVFQKP